MRLLTPQHPRWNDIGLHLSLAVPYHEWREAPWLCDVIGDADAPARPRVFQLVESPHVSQLESAVEQWLGDGSLPTLGHPASYLLALRFSTVGHLMMTFDGFFPPPPVSSVGETCQCFLLDWWRQHGAVYAVGYSCSEYEIDA